MLPVVRHLSVKLLQSLKNLPMYLWHLKNQYDTIRKNRKEGPDGYRISEAESSRMNWQQYDIMHGKRIAASVCKNGTCKIYSEQMMPYNLYLDEDSGDDIDIRIQNPDNFYHWCATRMLPLGREYVVTIQGGIPSFATQKPPLTPVSCSHGMRSQCAFLTRE